RDQQLHFGINQMSQPSLLFDYPSFLRVLEIQKFYSSSKKWFICRPRTKKSNLTSIHYISRCNGFTRSLLQQFFNHGAQFRTLHLDMCFLQSENMPPEFSMTTFPGGPE